MREVGITQSGWDAGDLATVRMSKPPRQDITKASTEFEGMLLAQVMGKLRTSFSGDAEDEGDAGANTLNGLAEQTLCQALATRGGIGLAALIRASVPENRLKVPR